MSEAKVEVVKIGKVTPLPNSDFLEFTLIYGGYPVLFKKGEYVEGDLAAYITVDSVVPDRPEWEFLKGHRRIKAKKLRGTFSMGLLAKPPLVSVQSDGSGMPFSGIWSEGDDATTALGITRYEPPEPLSTGGEAERDPQIMPVYDIEALRKYTDLLTVGEEVWISEKIHGASSRFVFDGERPWVGSHKTIKRESEHNMWWRVFRKYNMDEKLRTIPNLAVYGEVYGIVQDLHYSVPTSEQFRLVGFDVLNIKDRTWLSVDDFLHLMKQLDLPVVPTLYRGPWDPSLVSLAEGKTTMPGTDQHVREGIVVKPVVERQDYKLGRVFLKLHGQGYLLRKE